MRNLQTAIIAILTLWKLWPLTLMIVPAHKLEHIYTLPEATPYKDVVSLVTKEAKDQFHSASDLYLQIFNGDQSLTFILPKGYHGFPSDLKVKDANKIRPFLVSIMSQTALTGDKDKDKDKDMINLAECITQVIEKSIGESIEIEFASILHLNQEVYSQITIADIRYAERVPQDLKPEDISTLPNQRFKGSKKEILSAMLAEFLPTLDEPPQGKIRSKL